MTETPLRFIDRQAVVGYAEDGPGGFNYEYSGGNVEIQTLLEQTAKWTSYTVGSFDPDDIEFDSNGIESILVPDYAPVEAPIRPEEAFRTQQVPSNLFLERVLLKLGA